MNKKRYNVDKLFIIFSYILLTIILVCVLYPLYFVVIASISDPSAIYNGEVILAPVGINFDGYNKILSNKTIWLGYRNSFLYMVIGTFINLFVTLPAAYALSRKDLVGRKLIMGIFAFTMFFNGGLIPTYILVQKLHLYNTFSIMVLISALSVINLIIARTFFQSNIPEELLDAAKIDGCNNTYFFIKIVLPLSKAIIAVIGLYYAVGHWNSYFNGLIYLQDESLFPLQLILRKILINNKMLANLLPVDAYEEIEKSRKIAESLKYGIIIVASLPVIILYPFVQKYFVQGVMIGAIKG
jgi:putative aldouronate transport system permease protein